MAWGTYMTDIELQEWAELGRSITEIDRVRHAPPSGVWDNIAAAIEAGDSRTSTTAIAQTSVIGTEIEPADAVINLAAERGRRAPAANRRRHRAFLLAGAASVLVFVLGLSLFNTDEQPVTFVAEVTNAGMPEEFAGTAEAIVAVDDSPMLEITFAGDLPNSEPVELWVIKPDSEGNIVDMRSLGIVQPGDRSWVWPADLDPNEYSLVDLSIEPDDGVETHSGRSILRGRLTLI